VENHAAALYGALERSGIAQVALHRLDFGKFAQLGRIARQGADRTPAFKQGAGHVPADESGGSGDERRFHNRFWAG